MENNKIVEVLQQSENAITAMQSIIDDLTSQVDYLEAENETWQRVTDSGENIDMKSVAKLLNYKNIGRNKLFSILRSMDILMADNEPYQKYVNSDYFDVIEQQVQKGSFTIVNRKTIVTHKGMDFIRKSLDKYFGV